jgi:glycosyltransferase involved in cell wall biosynthesis
MSATAEIIPIRPLPPRPATVGVVFPGDPAAPGTWSGTPSGVITGLRALGAEPRALTAAPARRRHAIVHNAVALRALPRARRGSLGATLRMARAIARNSPALGHVYSQAAHRAVRGAGELDGLIQIGTGYRLPRGRPIATFEDMTIWQALETGYPEWRALSRRQIAHRLDAQMRAYEQARVCCFTSWWAANSAIEHYGVPAERVRVVGVGRNHAVDPPAERDWTVPRFLFIGWEWERKNGPAVVRAFTRLRRERPDATLDLVGRHPRIDGPGITDHGILRLSRPDERLRLEPLLRRATCFVMPSRVEPSALAYVEAMHAGLPAIGTTVGGADNLIGDGGCVVDPGSDDALLAAMAHFCDPERASATGRAARERSAIFTWPAVAARLLRALDLRIPGRADLDAFVDERVSPELTAAGTRR